MTIIKLSYQGDEMIRYPAVPLITKPSSITVKATFALDDVVTPYTIFAKGDCLHETFYADRWYNVFALYDGAMAHNERLKGWYCNLARPSLITPDTIQWTDLAIDLWVTPDGIVQILDWAEFMSIEPTLQMAEKAAVLSAITTIHQLAQQNKLPR